MARPNEETLHAPAPVHAVEADRRPDLAAAVALIVLAVPAFAHVEAEGETAATGITTVTFTFEHGCADSPTTSMKIQLPAGTTDVEGPEPDRLHLGGHRPTR